MTPKRAYRTLGLEVGASMEAVEEAFTDLRAVWNPDRLDDDAELQAKAKRKRAEIEEAVDVLRRAAAGRTDPSRQDLYKAIFAEGSSRARKAPRRPSRSEDGKPSLLSDTFSSERHQSATSIPLWAVGAGIFAVVLVVVMILSSGNEPANPIVPTPQIPEMQEPLTSATPVATPPEPLQEAEAETGPPIAQTEAAPTATPPPPPEPPSRQPRQRSTSDPATSAAEPTTPRGPRPRLIRTPAESQPPPPQQAGPPEPETAAAGQPPAQEPEPEPEPAIDPAAEQAFTFLQSKSDAALQLAGGLVSGLAFSRWQLTGQRGDSYLIDLIATRADGTELHHVWAVDPAAETVRALSQAARELERGVP